MYLVSAENFSVEAPKKNFHLFLFRPHLTKKTLRLCLRRENAKNNNSTPTSDGLSFVKIWERPK